jgi:hypothetical protein
MKSLLLALTLAGFAACSSTASVADTSAEAADAAKTECCAGEEGMAAMANGECDATKAASCDEAKTCPVTGKTIN